jgi:ribosomal protein L32
MATPKKQRSKVKILLRRNGMFEHFSRTRVHLVNCIKCNTIKRKFFLCLNCKKKNKNKDNKKKLVK